MQSVNSIQRIIEPQMNTPSVRTTEKRSKGERQFQTAAITVSETRPATLFQVLNAKQA